VKFRLNKQVEKDLRKIKEKKVLLQVKRFFEDIKESSSINDLTQIKTLKGKRNYYRYRFGDYRIGFKIEENEVLILKIAIVRIFTIISRDGKSIEYDNKRSARQSSWRNIEQKVMQGLCFQ
jgi:mRNA interferase RelE/StbE